MNYPLANLIQKFFTHYLPIQKGLSLNTVRAYRDAIKLLLCYAADTGKPVDKLEVEHITETLVLAFLDMLEKERGCSTRTRNARLAAIRSLFTFIGREKPDLLPQCQQIRAIPFKRTEYKAVDYLDEKEMQAVLNAVDNNTRTSSRDKALLLLLYNTGARVSEIIGLTLKNLRLDDSAKVSFLGKGKKVRSCPLWAETADAIKDYIQHRIPKRPDIEQLFLNANGHPLTRYGLRYITRKYGIKATSKALNPHSIRHTSAMHLLRSGCDVIMVSYWLGHADINTTHIYLEIDMDMKRKMIEQAGAPAIDKELPWQQPGIITWLNTLTNKSKIMCSSSAALSLNKQHQRQYEATNST